MNINKETKLYGSFSSNPGNNGCIFFNDLFERYGINSIYKSFYSIDIQKLLISVKHLNFSGFALSMPLKIEIIKYLDEIDSAALEIGAVNTVVNNNGKLKGYNTDYIGIKHYIIKNELITKFNDTIFILGNGGFSKAIQYALKQLNINYKIINRENWYELQNIKNTFVINATPIDIKSDNFNLIDGRPFTEQGKEIAKYQAIEQFKIYTGLNYE